MEGKLLTIYFFKWWYGEAYGLLLKYLKASFVLAFDLFSVRICLRTMFWPWKRDVTSYEGLALNQKFQVWTLNLASRFIGMLIKSLTLISFVVFVFLLISFSVASIVFWLLYPLLIIWLLYRALAILI